MKTYTAKPTDVIRKWYILDASQIPLGRLSTRAATLLTGKEKPQFTHNIDCGDYVIVINAANLQVTGKKMADKMYYRHSGFPSGLTETALVDAIAKDPTTPVIHSIRGMLPVNKLRDARLARLKVYAGSEHPHNPQAPTAIDLIKKGKK